MKPKELNNYLKRVHIKKKEVEFENEIFNDLDTKEKIEKKFD
jgi:hypothetical protein